ncbi:CubicO group peptidase, beta-lactamase class C family [Tindallia magadiensis]|uniref:CubicO group peptidase, beta-lactamase class C family n=1 Tax=Tindallia magadiensis TaxID=69895 RepID=A0A1I3ES96_9FIRM|nr:serine hydrolase [Tindallia magadiensis]SFI01854.1 CubicO group peptidase, beta-lactamase class C family [Tindallia magadiensis]
MYYLRFFILTLAVLAMLFLLTEENQWQEVSFPSTWTQYETPEEAGWSSDKLKKAREYYDELGSTSALLVHDGKIVIAWGDITKNTRAHSIRKSFLNALYGIYIEKDSINLDDTLEDLQIVDIKELTSSEKQATISDLLTSRSGVYLKAGEESFTMSLTRPPRSSYPPGTHFYYNNWDFNVLGTILNQQSQSDLFYEFHQKIAIPLGMEDFSLENTWYQFESNKSLHPSYLFRISARDMARFGQLYLQKGKWEDVQMISSEWIETSTKVHAVPEGFTLYGYGYLWWVAQQGEWEELGLYSAIGRYGQSIDIIPEKNILFVHRMDSDMALFPFLNQVTNHQRLYLLNLILDAKTEETKENPRIIPGILSKM